MTTYSKGLLLFLLNFFDAVLTLIWVRNNLAEEANWLMLYFLNLGDLPFLAVKLAVGTAAVLAFCKWRELKLAQFGLTFALGVYIALMGIHLLTGMTAAGLHPEYALQFLSALPEHSNITV
jgi:hypothetical protein